MSNRVNHFYAKMIVILFLGKVEGGHFLSLPVFLDSSHFLGLEHLSGIPKAFGFALFGQSTRSVSFESKARCADPCTCWMGM